ncbi:ArnT family glycosyltransferase [Perlucidibaca aquatica]|uniref:ArnT family glycosyltransferase n=1 Tax=Perlucidibaca aquatica TaxID=1852776 RepID=UPI00083A81E1|nr:glycosyltransferase family 39 protein [Perlucidibaca aquatica]
MTRTAWLSRLSLGQGVCLALLIKLVLAALLPMTGDEAYFVLWGRHLDYGYYDHPPMAGWMTWLMLQVSEHPVMVRLPGILTELLIALGLYAQWQRFDVEKARLLALVFLFSPLSLIFAFTLTDTGCMLFAAASSFAAVQALRHASPTRSTGHTATSYGWAALAGVFLGLAFLSKYFAVFLGLAYLIYFFAVNRLLWRLGMTLVLVAIPFGLINLYWNLNHCWANLLFNLVNRNRGEVGIQWADMLTYLAMMAYVVIPPLALAWWRSWRTSPALPAEIAEGARLARVIVLTALVGFLVVSLKKTIGLHWVLWFYPMVLMALFSTPVAQWQRWLGWMGWLSAAHVVVIFAILLVPYSVWQHQPKVAKDLLAATEAPALLAAARDQLVKEAGLSPAQAANLPVAARGYTWASVLSYQIKEPVMVIGPGSKYARQDDFWTDFRALDGRSILIYLKRPAELAAVSAWFEQVRTVNVSLHGQRYVFALGEGFNYARYWSQVLVPVRDKFYTAPDWLPVASCPVTERYFTAPPVAPAAAAIGVGVNTTASP